MQRQRELGRKTNLDVMPILSPIEVDLWNMYVYIGDDMLQDLEIYGKRIGFAPGWEFKDCLDLIVVLKNIKVVGEE